ncbi:hypothetical protein DFH06DRAFT_266334 [Mycena polygramma]|nr:hypothetical protein DFH06DRAFT_266334 [Mycena polygramma]
MEEVAKQHRIFDPVFFWPILGIFLPPFFSSFSSPILFSDAMESVVPQEITTELTQILSNLLLGDNEIRSNAETAVNERLAHTPELYLLALAQFAISADTEVGHVLDLAILYMDAA